MSVLFPSGPSWLTGKGIALTLFEDCLREGDLPEPLRGGLKLCLDAELDCLDLREASAAELAAFARAVRRVLRRRERDPAAAPVYLDALRELAEKVRRYGPDP